MKLVYKSTGIEAKIGDIIYKDGIPYPIQYFCPPHKPSSEGHVTCGGQEYYASAWGLEWIEREDRQTTMSASIQEHCEHTYIPDEDHPLQVHCSRCGMVKRSKPLTKNSLQSPTEVTIGYWVLSRFKSPVKYVGYSFDTLHIRLEDGTELTIEETMFKVSRPKD